MVARPPDSRWTRLFHELCRPHGAERGAQDAPSGKATSLRKLDQKTYDALAPKCPFANVPSSLHLMDYKSYHGWYHTDVTVPSDYFGPDVERPARVERKELDFT